MSARQDILGRVRAALSDVPTSEPATWTEDQDHDGAAAYARYGDVSGAALTSLFAERCGEYQARVTRVRPARPSTSSMERLASSSRPRGPAGGLAPRRS